MKALKGNRGLYISVGVLGLAIIGSGVFYKKEADKAKQLQAQILRAKDDLLALRNAIPTDEHKQHLEVQETQVKDDYKKIVREALEWNYVPKEVTAPTFQGRVLWPTINMLSGIAEGKQIVIGPRAKLLGFDEYESTPPKADEDILQLQRELSAATDIAELLIASDVHSIDLMARGDQALLMEDVTGSFMTVGSELSATTARRRSKVPYRTVPFRVRFSCTYPSLAFFQRSLVTPGKVAVPEREQVMKRPQNFLVINDLTFKVKQAEEQSADDARMVALDRTRSAAWALARGAPRDLVEIPGGMALWDSDRQQALRLVELWRTWTPEQRKIYEKSREIHLQSSEGEKERIRKEMLRLSRENSYRNLPGRPPQYTIMEITMLIDFIEFTDEVIAEIAPEGSTPGGNASSLKTAKK